MCLFHCFIESKPGVMTSGFQGSASFSEGLCPQSLESAGSRGLASQPAVLT